MVIKVYMMAMVMVWETLKKNAYFSLLSRMILLLGTHISQRKIIFWQDYNLVRKSDFKQVRNIKVIPCEKVVTQHLLLVSDLKWKFVKQTKKAFTPKLRTWKLRDHNVINLFKDRLTHLLASWRSLDAS